MEKKLYKDYCLNLFGEQTSINVFITDILSGKELEDKWRLIRNEIALEFQRYAENDFERWNYYIFYVVEGFDNMDINLKYRIEHDMYSSRKIVVDSKMIEGDIKDYAVNKYIRYDIVESINKGRNQPEFVRNEELKPIIKELLEI